MATIYVGKNITDLTSLGSGADGDTLIFGEGNQSITGTLSKWASLSGGGAGADGFDVVWVKPAFTGRIGGPTEHFRCDVSYSANSHFIYQAGGGECYYSPHDTDADLCDRFRNLGKGRVYFSGGGGTVTLLDTAMGTYTTVNGSVVITNVNHMGGYFYAANNATAITLARVAQGQFLTERTITTLVMAGGEFKMYRQDSSSTKPTITSATVTGGRFSYAGGNIPTLVAIGDAVLDFTQVTEPITIGATSCVISKDVIDRSKGLLNPNFVTIADNAPTTYLDVPGHTTDSLSG